MDEQKRLDRQAINKIREAIGAKADAATLDELAAGMPPGLYEVTAAAGHGDEAGLRWALGRNPKRAPGAHPALLGALWRGVELCISDVKKVEALIEALGLPRALGEEEGPPASRALCAAASVGGAGFEALLDVVEPMVSHEGDDRLQVWNAATGAGGLALRALKGHPAHGASMTTERQSEALRFALRSQWMGEALALEAVKELFYEAELGPVPAEEEWEAPLAMAAARGWPSVVGWMLDHGEGRISLAMGKAAERAAADNGFKSESFGGALSGWIRAMEERQALEAQARERSSQGPAQRGEGKRPRV